MSRKSRYIHTLRAMRKGDVVYLPDKPARLDKAVTATVWRGGGKCLTACFVAVNLDPATAHRVVRVTMLRHMHSKRLK